MSAFENVIANLHDVATEPVMHRGVETDFKLIVDQNSGKVMSVQRKSYRLVKHSEILGSIDEAIARSGLDLSGATTQLAWGGSDQNKMIMRLRLPAYTIEPKVGDMVAMELTFKNSYDGTIGLSTELGGLRLRCTNGMVTSAQFLRSWARHTANVNVPGMAGRLVAATEQYERIKDQWADWSGRRIEREPLDALIAKVADNEKRVEWMGSRWEREVQELGHTKWAAYNLLTAYSTHYGADDAKHDGGRLTREARVRKVMPVLEAL